jgi:CBS domain-containing protein
VARALIWRSTGDLTRATEIAAAIGRGFGYLMIGLGVFAALAGGFGGLWLALIGIFVIAAGRAEEGGLRIRTAFSGREARNLMTFPAVSVPAGITVADAVSDYFVPRRFSAFPVLDEGRLVGLIDRATVERLPAGRRASATVGEVCIDDPTLFVAESQDVADLIEQPAFQRVGRAIVTTADGRPGILSITDVNQVLAALRLAEGAGPTARSA